MLEIKPELQITSLKRTAESEITEVEEKKMRIDANLNKRKMSVILMMYSGVGYYGMQRNVGFKTIEGELFDALMASNLIDQASRETPGRVRFQRASKTDKSVSACGQVCSLKIPDDDQVVEKLNSFLPDEIRIMDVFRTTKNFNCKSQCKNRTYRYITPSFAFAPRDTDAVDLSNYRMSQDVLDLVNRTLLHYKGTRNYHNFTSGRVPTDKSCQRYMISVTCEAPFVRDELEYVTINVNGQSFMLHQIRKMIGLAMAVVRGYCDDSVFERAFSLKKVDVPRAPGLGLILDRVNYDFYNSKHCADGARQSIDWDKYSDQIRDFREKHIYSHIYRIEKEDKQMLCWLETLLIHSYVYREVTVADSSHLVE